MRKLTKLQKRAMAFWLKRTKAGNYVIKGNEFPDEYVRKALRNEDLLAEIKKGLYIIKNRGDSLEDMIYHAYWPIVSVLLREYAPWAIEKEAALRLHLGDESIPSKLVIRSAKKINYGFEIFKGLTIQIHPDKYFNLKTRQALILGKNKLYIDVPERVLFTVKNRKSASLRAFIKSYNYNRRMLEALYADNPKPIVAKELIQIASPLNHALAVLLKSIVHKFTIYRA
ncbi:MAG: hypothetical protein QME05_03870 [Candidatus Margulisbacteria bacterium]|nr:hypothetical protein [Candidatus Margulisiibacteriota bacterium]